MGQQIQTSRKAWTSSDAWRSGDVERIWLSMLVDAMEAASCPEVRKIPSDPQTLIALRAHLARPASLYPYGASNFSLRN